MNSAWLLPEHVADVLPAQARRVEEMRRRLLDLAYRYGCELVMPPLVEHLESLLSGAGHGQELRTFKLVDQLSGRTLGLRADMTPQAARIDAHLLNRQGVTRLCYCGPVVHARPSGPLASREPLQFGVEVFGHAGLEADLEVLEVALDALEVLSVPQPVLVLGDARCIDAILSSGPVDKTQRAAILAAMAVREPGQLSRAAEGLPGATLEALQQLLTLEGGSEVLARARSLMVSWPALGAALNDLTWLLERLNRSHPALEVGIDLAAVAGNAYYTGVCFSVYGSGQHGPLLRGGRYDEVGAAFGRRRPAVGFSLDLKAVADAMPNAFQRPAVRAPWGDDATLHEAIRRLRNAGETVVCVLPGHEDEGEEYACDRELVRDSGGPVWTVRALPSSEG
ncbi:MAG: ATP phosphoribosyltransferase regulatory subunit [Inhella sp.]|jgi:ATP phosphoribosyltransferase regulatory subunit|uniref:ATP phosphoribosyltransferase regulatory subunit n=1 Tax=Inhella sp. TaxID=1921806 RepID=UPI0022C6C6DD|nr:ATP phosphoribosyltransferase regulatory subunit [Polaromonas sp.]